MRRRLIRLRGFPRLRRKGDRIEIWAHAKCQFRRLMAGVGIEVFYPQIAPIFADWVEWWSAGF